MPFERKIPDRDMLAKLCADGMTQEHIAETYGVGVPAVRRRLIEYGLIDANTKAARLERALAYQRPVEPRAGEIRLLPDRLSLTHNFFVDGTGYKVRPLTLPRISMHLKALADRRVKVREVANV